jgi:hypothetical protein
MLVYVLSIFISAFLLFQIQPMIAKYILPWFGGITTVWSTVMLFFQVLLTGGYAYGHYLIGRIKTRQQWKVHSILLAFSVVLILVLALIWSSPITPPATWKPQTVDNPIWHIFFLLSISIGLPYFMLSTNSPLMQAWFNRAFPGVVPYRLYALSNFGSLLALITYPIIVEPVLALRLQGWIWSGLYIAFASLAAYAAFSSRKAGSITPETIPATVNSEAVTRPKTGVITLWIALSATASVMLLAVTNQITQEVASIPFLWILPLTIYLLSFILAFESERWYSRIPYMFLLLLSSIGFIYIVVHPRMNYLVQLAIYAVLMFACFMICHGELYRLRPNPSHLTLFYLMVSIGGAAGGIFVNFVAPVIFNGYWEMNYGLAFVWILLMVMTFVRPTPIAHLRLKFIFDLMIGISAVCILIVTVFLVNGLFSNMSVAERNFYGVLRVKQSETENNQQVNTLYHGITIHGIQFTDPAKRDIPTAYYNDKSGAALAILNHPKYGHGMKVGILGLGIGTLVSYGQPGDEYRLYEINPAVVELAESKGGYFSFLQDSKTDYTVVLGDARISLERELAEGQSDQFDILVLDAFNSDSIPVHLLTKEAFELYLQQLGDEGIIATHITNKHLDLLPVVWQLAQHFNLSMAVINTPGDADQGVFASKWVLLSRDPALLENPAIVRSADPMAGYSSKVRLWTDDYSNLFQILR